MHGPHPGTRRRGRWRGTGRHRPPRAAASGSPRSASPPRRTRRPGPTVRVPLPTARPNQRRCNRSDPCAKSSRSGAFINPPRGGPATSIRHPAFSMKRGKPAKRLLPPFGGEAEAKMGLRKSRPTVTITDRSNIKCRRITEAEGTDTGRLQPSDEDIVFGLWSPSRTPSLK